MFEIYSFTLETISLLHPHYARIARNDPDLGRQLKRALQSVALNIAEGNRNQGGHRRARFHTTMGSSREVLSCFEVAVAMQISRPVPPPLLDRLDRINATLWKLTHELPMASTSYFELQILLGADFFDVTKCR